MISELKGYSIITLFIIYCLLLTAINYLLQSFLITNTVLHNSYAEQLSYERVEEIIQGQNKYAWVGYAILPLIYAVKFLLIGCCLLLGSLFFDIKLKFSDAFKIALLADIIFIIPL